MHDERGGQAQPLVIECRVRIGIQAFIVVDSIGCLIYADAVQIHTGGKVLAAEFHINGQRLRTEGGNQPQ